MFALVNANSFYCSAEQVFRPQWRGKPIIVLSNNDGCIVAANKQATALGIQKFQPFFKVQKLCAQKGIITCFSNYELYADLSHKMMQVIGRFGPLQHIFFIEESFLNFKECKEAILDLMLYAQKNRQAVYLFVLGLVKQSPWHKWLITLLKSGLGLMVSVYLMMIVLKEGCLSNYHRLMCGALAEKPMPNYTRTGSSQQLSQLSMGYLPAGFNVELQRTIKKCRGLVILDKNFQYYKSLHALRIS